MDADDSFSGTVLERRSSPEEGLLLVHVNGRVVFLLLQVSLPSIEAAVVPLTRPDGDDADRRLGENPEEGTLLLQDHLRWIRQKQAPEEDGRAPVAAGTWTGLLLPGLGAGRDLVVDHLKSRWILVCLLLYYYYYYKVFFSMYYSLTLWHLSTWNPMARNAPHCSPCNHEFSDHLQLHGRVWEEVENLHAAMDRLAPCLTCAPPYWRESSPHVPRDLLLLLLRPWPPGAFPSAAAALSRTTAAGSA